MWTVLIAIFFYSCWIPWHFLYNRGNINSPQRRKLRPKWDVLKNSAGQFHHGHGDWSCCHPVDLGELNKMPKIACIKRSGRKGLWARFTCVQLHTLYMCKASSHSFPIFRKWGILESSHRAITDSWVNRIAPSPSHTWRRTYRKFETKTRRMLISLPRKTIHQIFNLWVRLRSSISLLYEVLPTSRFLYAFVSLYDVRRFMTHDKLLKRRHVRM